MQAPDHVESLACVVDVLLRHSVPAEPASATFLRVFYDASLFCLPASSWERSRLYIFNALKCGVKWSSLEFIHCPCGARGSAMAKGALTHEKLQIELLLVATWWLERSWYEH